jgi:hypothetical protein
VEKGMFGIGGGGWHDGCTLVLTLHGYLHVFGATTAPCKAADTSAQFTASRDEQAPTSDASGSELEEELVESAIKASVYVPMAVRCVFLRKGKEYSVDLAEAEATGASDKQPGGLGSGLRRWLSKDGSGAKGTVVPPRKVQARVEDEFEFSTLERRCHEFVRRGQSFRQAVAHVT